VTVSKNLNLIESKNIYNKNSRPTRYVIFTGYGKNRAGVVIRSVQ